MRALNGPHSAMSASPRPTHSASTAANSAPAARHPRGHSAASQFERQPSALQRHAAAVGDPGPRRHVVAKREHVLQRIDHALKTPTAASQSVERPELSSLQLQSKGTQLLDSRGRHVMLRGVNAGGASKKPPFFPFPFAESGHADQKDAPPFAQAAAQYLDRVSEWGHNFIRMPFSWEAVEPRRGQYDETYLERLQDFVKAAESRGLRVLVDFHQDVFARPYHGDGFPLWAMTGDKDDKPIYDERLWPVGYFVHPDVNRDFTRFWNNEDGLRDAFKDMWRQVASKLGDADGVIGFEIINEPDAGNVDHQRWESKVLPRFFEDVGDVIQSAAPNKLLFFESEGTEPNTDDTHLEPPGGDGDWVYSPHAYSLPRMALAQAGPLSPLARYLGPGRPGVKMDRIRGRGEDWNVPMLVGEFGISTKAYQGDEWVRRSYEALDAARLNAAIWEYSEAGYKDWNKEAMSLVDADGSLTDIGQEAVRPYPAAVAGKLRNFFYASEQRKGWVSLQAKPGVSEMRVPKALASNGLTVHIDSKEPVEWRYDADAQTLLLDSSTQQNVNVFFKLE